MAPGTRWASKASRLLTAVTVLAVGLAGCAKKEAPAGPTGAATVRIAEQAACVCQLAFYVATEQGLFTKHNIHTTFVTEPTPLTGILTNAADMSMASPGQAALAQTKGGDVRVLVTAQSRLTQAVFVRPNVTLSDPSDWKRVMQDLKGRKIGITTRGGSTDTNLRYILSQAGLNPDTDVQIVPLGAGPSMVAGVKAGQVDAALSFQPLTATMLAQKLGTVAIDLAQGQGPSALDQPMTTGIVRGDFAKANPKVLKNILAAMTDTVAFMKDPANRAQVIDVARKHLAGTDDPTLTALLDQLLPLLRTTYTDEDNQRVNAVLVESKLLKTAIPYGRLTTPETQK